jgi:hypothetical protein
MGTYLEKKVGGEGALSRFLGFWAVMVNALFAYIGTELIGVTVGEAQNPRKNIPESLSVFMCSCADLLQDRHPQDLLAYPRLLRRWRFVSNFKVSLGFDLTRIIAALA